MSDNSDEHGDSDEDTESEVDNNDDEEMTTEKVLETEDKNIDSDDESASKSSTKLRHQSSPKMWNHPLNAIKTSPVAAGFNPKLGTIKGVRLSVSSRDTPKKVTDSMVTSTDLQHIITAVLCNDLFYLNEVIKCSVKEQCLRILSHRYIFT